MKAFLIGIAVTIPLALLFGAVLQIVPDRPPPWVGTLGGICIGYACVAISLRLFK